MIVRAGGGRGTTFVRRHLRQKGGLQFMTETEIQTKDAKIFTWVVGALMVILVFYGLLTIIGVIR
jgi:hypothetical protein